MTEPKEDFLSLRDARAEELDEAGLLIRDAYQEYRAAFPTELWEAYVPELMDTRSRIDKSELIVAEDGGRIVGCVTFYPSASQSEEESWPAEWAGIRLLAVHPDARGRGIGRSLMNECLRRCRQRAVPTLVLHTTEAMGVARSMYERMGFARIAEHDFKPAPSVVVMAYRLDF